MFFYFAFVPSVEVLLKFRIGDFPLFLFLLFPLSVGRHQFPVVLAMIRLVGGERRLVCPNIHGERDGAVAPIGLMRCCGCYEAALARRVSFDLYVCCAARRLDIERITADDKKFASQRIHDAEPDSAIPGNREIAQGSRPFADEGCRSSHCLSYSKYCAECNFAVV